MGPLFLSGAHYTAGIILLMSCRYSMYVYSTCKIQYCTFIHLQMYTEIGSDMCYNGTGIDTPPIDSTFHNCTQGVH
jgi:hypothetical protein